MRGCTLAQTALCWTCTGDNGVRRLFRCDRVFRSLFATTLSYHSMLKAPSPLPSCRWTRPCKREVQTTISDGIQFSVIYEHAKWAVPLGVKNWSLFWQFLVQSLSRFSFGHCLPRQSFSWSALPGTGQNKPVWRHRWAVNAVVGYDDTL